MSECTTCSYYGKKHLEGPSEEMPWPCVECPGGEKYVERGKRKHQVPLRVQLADAEHRLVELQESVRWERECDSAWYSDNLPLKAPALYELFATYEAARAAVDAMIGGEV